MSCRLLSTTLLAAFVGLFLFPGQSQAAPQILAVLATETGVPFTCDGEFCRVDLSTYCLQRDRPAPQAGTQYLPAHAKDFTLTVKTASGKVRNLPATEHVTFAETRGFMSTAAIIEERQLRRLGSLEATIQVGEQASMLPVPTPGDPDSADRKGDRLRHAVAAQTGLRYRRQAPRGGIGPGPGTGHEQPAAERPHR